ncbi:HET domain-containing protein [Fusarium sp. Ph1]|nr:HET domain-containing protein [Fusarium sp. Ph1]
MDPSSSFIYKPLDRVTSEIRVVRIPPKDDDSLWLDTVCLDDNPTFVALSYVWGDPNITEAISLDNQPFQVTKNLAAALKHIRGNCKSEQFPNRVQSLWVDAVCINQQDFDERTRQVQLMSRVYKSAAVVLAWLGPGDHSLAYSTINLLAKEMHDDTRGGLNEEKLSRLDWLQDHPSLCSDDGPRQSGSGFRNLAWSAVATFVRDPYWTRLWIFQEVILARELVFISNGLALVTWPMFYTFQKGFDLLRKNIRKLSLPRPNHLSPSVWLALATELAGVSNIEQPCFARGIFRILQVVARDYIYGLLAITEPPIVPDYNKTVSDVYIEYTAAWVETCRDTRIERFITSLSFLSHAGVGIYGFEADFPSWAPNFPADGKLPISTRMETGHADIGVFGDDSSKLPFVVARTKSLFVWGIEVDKVHFVAQDPVYGLSTDKLEPQQQDKVLRDLRFSTDPVEFEAQFRKCFAHGANFRQLGFDRNLRDIMMEWPKGVVGESWQRMELQLIRLITNWRLISTSGGYLGFAPRGTAVGDRLCVLKGSDVPVLLRRTDLGSYTVVGTTFVEGLMDGEAAELEQVREGIDQWFQMQ